MEGVRALARRRGVGQLDRARGRGAPVAALNELNQSAERPARLAPSFNPSGTSKARSSVLRRRPPGSISFASNCNEAARVVKTIVSRKSPAHEGGLTSASWIATIEQRTAIPVQAGAQMWAANSRSPTTGAYTERAM